MGTASSGKQLKRRQESINGFVTVHRDPYQETPGVQQFSLPTQKFGSTGLQMGTHGRFMVQGVVIPSDSELREPEQSKLGTYSTEASNLAALPELLQIK